MATINTLIRKASSLLRITSHDGSSKAVASDGEVIFCKNNVCVHPPTPLRTEMDHHPGYLTIRTQHDNVLGSTLILSWIPNSTLRKNPRSLENRTPNSSPCRSARSSACPSPTTVHRSSFTPSYSGNTSPYPSTFGEKSLEEMTGNLPFQSTPGEHDRRSISSTISDLGSPREDIGSLDSWTMSDQAEMSASTGSQGLSVSTSDTERNEQRSSRSASAKPGLPVGSETTGPQNHCVESQSDSGIGPEEVTAALESMISGLNAIEAGFFGGTCIENNSNKSSDHNQDTTEVQHSLAQGENDRPGGEDVKDLSHVETRSSVSAVDSNNLVNSRNIEPKLQCRQQENAAKPHSEMKQKLRLDLSSRDKICRSDLVGKTTPDISIDPQSSSSSTTPTTSNRDPESYPSTPADSPPLSPLRRLQMKYFYVEGTPESLAHAHNLTFPDTPGSMSACSPGRQLPRESSCGVFSVDLSQMRSLRLFFSNKECTCGQLVIASRESQYKILHFHFGGLDKLACVFEEWDFLSKGKSKIENCPYRQFSICRPEVTAAECHPEEGVYGIVDEVEWRQFMNDNGYIEDDFQLRKAIFFGGLETSLRKEAWPFLLRHYSFQSTFDARDQIRNDKYIEYQTIRRKRNNMTAKEQEVFFRNIQCTVEKDVVRTDRSNPFFAGDNNPNIDIMKNILLNYAIYNPVMGYTQGMSDLLAPVLAEIQDESEAFWCFVGLMQRTIFVTSPKDVDMDANLKLLRELLRLMTPAFFNHLRRHSDVLELLFAHRWILLCFKREFPEQEALKMWEACWAHYQTDYFHLFLCVAIVAIYGDDVIAQDLRADEVLLHFSSLAMHMNGELILQKARGLLHQFRLFPRIPCSLANLCELCGPGMWDSGHVPVVECTGNHGNHSCPSGGQDPTMKNV